MQKNNTIKLKIILIIIIYLSSLLLNITRVFGAELKDGEYLPTVPIIPDESQYLELKAVEIKDVEGQNKQVIMELWANNLIFKRI